ncbi:hypothetical protein OEA41_008641 [Lepraria neglecta]|uniref:Uncharacterized protein n=1 Tax=Lepraria neglecta TaxID=209136 RepID=A0AAE0DJI8_9LECA|nr:hypothetical protein OEA41_008641 [Lepraria neglecta]
MAAARDEVDLKATSNIPLRVIAVALPAPDRAKANTRVAVGDSLAEDRNTQDAQREAGGSIGHTSDDLTADRGDEEREAVRLDLSIVTYDTDSDDSDAFTALRKKLTPQFKYPSILRPKDRNNLASSTRNKPGSPGDPIVVQDEDTDSSGDGTSEEEQVGNHVSFRTSPTSVGGSEAGYSTLCQKSKQDTPNTSPPHRNTLSSTPGKRTCGSKGRDCEGLTPDPSTGRDKKNPWNGQEGSTKKRHPSAVKGSLRRSVAAVCHLSEMKLSAVKDHNGDTENDDTSATSCSTDNIIPYSLRSPIAMWSPTHFTDAEPETTTGATDIRDYSKRTADRARLNEGGEGVHRLEKARCADPIMIDETDDNDDDMNDPAEHRRFLSLAQSAPRPVFRSPFDRKIQHRENASSSRSSEIGDSQDDPLVVEDDEEKTGETGGSTRATSMESEIGTAHLKAPSPGNSQRHTVA